MTGCVYNCCNAIASSTCHVVYNYRYLCYLCSIFHNLFIIYLFYYSSKSNIEITIIEKILCAQMTGPIEGREHLH